MEEYFVISKPKKKQQQNDENTAIFIYLFTYLLLSNFVETDNYVESRSLFYVLD